MGIISIFVSKLVPLTCVAGSIYSYYTGGALPLTLSFLVAGVLTNR